MTNVGARPIEGRGWRAAVASLIVGLWFGAARAEPPRCLGDSPLHVAVSSGDAAEVARLLAERPELRGSLDALGETPLLRAVREGRDARIVALFLGGPAPEIDDPGQDGATPLVRAAWEGKAALVRALLAAGASVERATSDGRNVLHAAARRGLAALLPTLALKAGKDALEAEDDDGLTPLDHAALAGSAPSIRALRAAGAVVRPKTIALACGAARLDLAQSLASSNVDRRPRVAPDRLAGALAWAMGGARRFDAPMMSCLFDAGAEPSVEALGWALQAGREDAAAQILLRSESSFGSERGTPMIHVAAAHGATRTLEALLALGASIEATDAQGATALQRAVLLDDGDAVRLLLAHGADVAARFAGASPVELAQRRGALRALAALGETVALDLAAWVAIGDEAKVDALLAADAAAAGRVALGGLTPLQVAARFDRAEIARRLIAAGAPLDATAPEGAMIAGAGGVDQSVAGWTALHFAAAGQHVALYRLLLASGARDVANGEGELAAAMLPPPRISDAAGDVPEGEKSLDEDDAGLGFIGNEAAPSAPVVSGAPAPRASAGLSSLGGGVLRDERRYDEEILPDGAIAPERVTGIAPALPRLIARCIGQGHWFEADRLARAWLAARAVPPLPEALGGPGRALQALLTASSQQTLGRIAIERRRMVEAERAFADASRSLAAAGEVPRSLEERVLAAVQAGKARLHAQLGLLADAEADLRFALERVAVAATAIRGRLLGALARVLGEAARYADAVAAARQALTMVGVEGGPSPRVLRHNLATLLGRAGQRDEAKKITFEELALVEHPTSDAPLTDEDAAMIRFTAGLWRALDGALDAGVGLIRAAHDELAKARDDHPALGRFGLGLGLALAEGGRLDAAEEALVQAQTELLVAEDAIDVADLTPASAIDYARVLVARARIARERGKLEEAEALGREAYAIAVGSEVLEARAAIELELARVAAARHKLPTAIWFGKRAVASLDRIRNGLASRSLATLALDDDQFVAERIGAWRELADHLVSAGRFLEATAALAAVKDEEADAYATRGKAKRQEAGPPPTDMPIVGRERQGGDAERGLEGAQRNANALAEAVTTGDPNEATRARLEQARRLLRERRRAFESWLEKLEGELAGMAPARAQAIAAMNLRDLAGMQDTLQTVGEGVVLVHYLLTEDRVRAIVTTSDSQVGREAPIALADLHQLVFQFRQVVADATRDPRTAANALYRVLIAPIEQDLAEAKATTLIVSLDGALRYAPLAALWDGKQWLVERYRVVSFARASLPKLMAPRPDAESLAAFGCGRPVPGFEELKAVPGELESIVKRDAADPDGELPGVVKLDDAFSKEALEAVLGEKRFSAVHIASHFVLGPGSEAESYLLLGDGQRLTLEDMRYDLRFDGVDLLSLSACNTAVGDGAGGGDGGRDGREIEGFASLALRLGARAVLATLWPVSDASTGLFMRTLYRNMRTDPKRSRADDLRLTMLAFIHGEVALDGGAGDRGPRPLSLVGTSPSAGGGVTTPKPPIDLKHPRYWAPFVFIGNWR